MPSKFCPWCNERYVIGFDVTDFVHQCSSGNPAIDQEDVVITGDWQDFSGEGTRSPQEVLRAGAHNELFGRRAEIQFGADKEELTRRGARASTHRQRQRLTFIDLKEKKKWK